MHFIEQTSEAAQVNAHSDADLNKNGTGISMTSIVLHNHRFRSLAVGIHIHVQSVMENCYTHVPINTPKRYDQYMLAFSLVYIQLIIFIVMRYTMLDQYER